MKNREQENIRVVRRFVREVFNAGRVDVLDEIAAMNWKDNGTRAPQSQGGMDGKSALSQRMNRFRIFT